MWLIFSSRHEGIKRQSADGAEVLGVGGQKREAVLDGGGADQRA